MHAHGGALSAFIDGSSHTIPVHSTNSCTSDKREQQMLKGRTPTQSHISSSMLVHDEKQTNIARISAHVYRGTHTQLITHHTIGIWGTGSVDVGLIQSTKAPKHQSVPPLAWRSTLHTTGVPRSSETASSWDAAVGMCIGPYGGRRGG